MMVVADASGISRASVLRVGVKMADHAGSREIELAGPAVSCAHIRTVRQGDQFSIPDDGNELGACADGIKANHSFECPWQGSSTFFVSQSKPSFVDI